MSHVVSIKTELKDLEAIKKACQRLGWTFKEGQKTYKWWGRWMDDSPLPEGLFSKEEEDRIKSLNKDARKTYMNGLLGRCQHVIQPPKNYDNYEIGLVKVGEKYIPLWDTMGLPDITPDNGMGGFLQAYAVEKAKLEAQRQGHSWEETTLADGTVKLSVKENF